MKKNDWLIVLSLLVCLFIYLFYRTEKTVINQLFISVFSVDTYAAFRNVITENLLLNKHVIYSLPEGLWVFCITLTSKYLYIKIGHRNIRLIFIPLLFSIGLELFQLLHVTNGRFDFWDIGFAIFFWLLAHYFITPVNAKQNIFRPFNTASGICLFSYLIVYLAHVWQ